MVRKHRTKACRVNGAVQIVSGLSNLIILYGGFRSSLCRATDLWSTVTSPCMCTGWRRRSAWTWSTDFDYLLDINSERLDVLRTDSPLPHNYKQTANVYSRLFYIYNINIMRSEKIRNGFPVACGVFSRWLRGGSDSQKWGINAAGSSLHAVNHHTCARDLVRHSCCTNFMKSYEDSKRRKNQKPTPLLDEIPASEIRGQTFCVQCFYSRGSPLSLPHSRSIYIYI